MTKSLNSKEYKHALYATAHAYNEMIRVGLLADISGNSDRLRFEKEEDKWSEIYEKRIERYAKTFGMTEEQFEDCVTDYRMGER